ncbi:MAG: hypothetical protein KBS74_08380 [Clostridiales bacterium]|nr:hypothetical protein [Candidatus Cacconaster stercorequi]
MEVMEFELGNPQEEAAPPKRIQKKNPRRKWLVFGIVLVAVLLVVLIAALCDSTIFDGLRRGVIYARADKDESGCAQLYQYSNEKNCNYASVDGSMITASVGQLQVLGEDGTVRYTTGLKFEQSAITCSESQVAVYDIGGTEIYILDAQGLVRQLRCDGTILTANLNEDGWLAVTANKSGYKAAVYVYDDSGEKVFEFDSSERFVMTASVCGDGEQMAAVTMGQTDGTFVSSVVIYRLNRDEPYAACDLPGDAVYHLDQLHGQYCAVAEDAIYFVDRNGSLAGSYDYSGEFLRRCCFAGEDYAAVLLGTYKSGSQGRLVTLNDSGKEIASLEVDGEILSMSAAGRYVAALYSDHLTIYNRKLQEVDTLTDISSAKEVLMRRDGSAVMAGNESASLYLP